MTLLMKGRITIALSKIIILSSHCKHLVGRWLLGRVYEVELVIKRANQIVRLVLIIDLMMGH